MVENNGILSGQQKYYRWQEDKQVVIERTPDQQKIFKEYFVIENKEHKNKYMLIAAVVVLAVAVIFMIIGGATQSVAMFVIGGIAIVAGLVCMYLYGRGIKYAPDVVMTDEEYEELVKRHIEGMDVLHMGLEKLGIDEEQVKEIRPIVLRDKVITDTSLKVYNPKDHSIHSSTQYVILLFFTDEQLLVYKLQFDMCCNLQIELTSEFFYKDICDVSSHEQRNVLAIGEDKFECSTITFNIISSNSEIGFSMDGESERYNSVLGMKQKIREMKLR